MAVAHATRLTLAAALVAALALTYSGALAVAQQAPTFRSGARIVPLYTTVTDETGRLVPDATRDDFEILDNGKPQTLALFDNQIQPITVTVMLDTSGSMTLNIDLVRAGAEQFVLRLLPADKALVGAFNDKIQLATPFTGDRDELLAGLKDLDFGNATRLYDAIGVCLEELKGIDGRRVVLIFTDGDDTASRQESFGRVLDRARTDEVMVYAIGLESNYFDGRRQVRTKPDRNLKKIADETGGGYFELQKTAELNSTFTRVAQELHSQYVLGFVPETLDNKIHKLEVRVKKPGLKARARKSYVASPERTR